MMLQAKVELRLPSCSTPGSPRKGSSRSRSFSVGGGNGSPGSSSPVATGSPPRRANEYYVEELVEKLQGIFCGIMGGVLQKYQLGYEPGYLVTSSDDPLIVAGIVNDPLVETAFAQSWNEEIRANTIGFYVLYNNFQILQSFVARIVEMGNKDRPDAFIMRLTEILHEDLDLDLDLEGELRLRIKDAINASFPPTILAPNSLYYLILFAVCFSCVQKAKQFLGYYQNIFHESIAALDGAAQQELTLTAQKLFEVWQNGLLLKFFGKLDAALTILRDIFDSYPVSRNTTSYKLHVALREALRPLLFTFLFKVQGISNLEKQEHTFTQLDQILEAFKDFYAVDLFAEFHRVSCEKKREVIFTAMYKLVRDLLADPGIRTKFAMALLSICNEGEAMDFYDIKYRLNNIIKTHCNISGIDCGAYRANIYYQLMLAICYSCYTVCRHSSSLDLVYLENFIANVLTRLQGNLEFCQAPILYMLRQRSAQLNVGISVGFVVLLGTLCLAELTSVATTAFMIAINSCLLGILVLALLYVMVQAYSLWQSEMTAWQSLGQALYLLVPYLLVAMLAFQGLWQTPIISPVLGLVFAAGMVTYNLLTIVKASYDHTMVPSTENHAAIYSKIANLVFAVGFAVVIGVVGFCGLAYGWLGIALCVLGTGYQLCHVRSNYYIMSEQTSLVTEAAPTKLKKSTSMLALHEARPMKREYASAGNLAGLVAASRDSLHARLLEEDSVDDLTPVPLVRSCQGLH